MFNVIHAADWHIGPFIGPEENGVNLREQDTEACIEKLVTTVEEKHPELVLVPGDIFHVGKTWGDRQSREVITARRAIMRMKAAAGVVIVMRGTPNHDGAGQFELLKEFFSDMPDVRVVDYPQVIKTKWADVAVVPGFDRGTFRAKFSGLGKEEENEVLSNELSNIVMGLRAECTGGRPAVLMAHYTVPGCEDAGSHCRLLLNMEPVLYKETLEAAGFDLVALGHIHKPQRIDGNIFYSGSLNALTFNDEGEKRGFWLHHFGGDGTPGLMDSEFVRTPYREFLTLRLKNEDIAAVNAGRLDEVALQYWRLDGCIQGKIVRVFYECTEDNNKAFNRGAFQQAMYEDGAFYVEVSPEKVEAVADRTDMDKNTDPEENLKIYLEENGKETEDISRLISLGRPIISEAAATGKASGMAGIFEPVEIAVKNYRTYEEERFDFSDVTFCTINGQNGAGKSSLFMDAIIDCLYEQPREGAAAKGQKEVPWLRKDEKARSGSISFTFKIGEHMFRVVRTRTKSGKPTLNLSEYVDGAWEDRSREKVADTQEEIENLIGMDCTTFQSCALIMQDNYGLFLQATKDKRMEIFSNLLGLGIYAEMEGIAKDKVQDLRRIVAGKRNEIETHLATIREIGNPGEELEAERESLRQLGEKKAEVVSQLKIIQSELSAAQKAKERCDSIEEEIASTQSKVKALGENRSGLDCMVKEIDGKLSEADDVSRDADEYRRLEGRARELIEQTATYTARLNEKRTIEQDIRETETLKEKTTAGIAAAEGEIRQFEERCDIETIQGKATEYEAKKKVMDDLYEKRRLLDGVNQKLSDARHALAMKEGEYDRKSQLLDREIDDLKRRTELLENSGCIDPENASCRFLSDALAAKEAMEKIPERRAKIQEEKADALAPLRKNIEEAEKEVSDLAFDEDEFYRVLAECNDLKPYVAKLEALQEQQKRIAVLRGSILQSKDTLEAHDEKLETLKLRLQEAEETLFNTRAAFEEHQKIKDRLPLLAPAVEKEKSIPVLREKRQNAMERSAEIIVEIENLGAEIAKKTAAMQEERKLTENLSEYKTQVEELARSQHGYEENERAVQVKIGGLEQKEKDRKRMAGKVKEIQEQVNETAKSLADYEVLRNAFSSDGIPHQIIRKVLPRLENTANTILGQMTGGKMGVRFVTEKTMKSNSKKETVTLDVVIEEYGKAALPYLSKSGGEKVKASLAVILALAEIKSSAAGIRLGMLFIDEPPFLDNDGIQAYCDALETIRERYSSVRVMAITHDISMKSRFPQSVEVVKTNEGSKVIY